MLYVTIVACVLISFLFLYLGKLRLDVCKPPIHPAVAPPFVDHLHTPPRHDVGNNSSTTGEEHKKTANDETACTGLSDRSQHQSGAGGGASSFAFDTMLDERV
jgi:hypothetical protein